eukprot:788836-Prorocentrum_minimum.AAC.2
MARFLGSSAAFSSGLRFPHHPLNDIEDCRDQLQRHLCACLLECLLEGCRLLMAPRQIDDEFRQSLVTDAQVIIQLSGDL